MESDNFVRISYATAEEWETAMEIAWKTFLLYEADEYGEEGKQNFLEFVSSEQLYKMFLLGGYVLAVAYCDDKMVGMASLRSGNHISLLFVDNKYHRHGIGTALLSFLQEGLEEGPELTVNASPYGEPFYTKVGFVKTDDWTKTDGITYLPMKCEVKIERNI